MSTVVWDISMSLDGYVTAEGVSAQLPMGAGGARLHEWAFHSRDDANGDLLRRSVADSGAFVCGRRTFDVALGSWGADGPSGPARLPLVVLTHRRPQDLPDGGAYHVVTGGLQEGLARARELAKDRQIAIMSADVGGQALQAGLVDEVCIHLVPVLLGAGTRLFDLPGAGQVTLAPPTVLQTPEATHLRYRVVRDDADAGDTADDGLGSGDPAD